MITLAKATDGTIDADSTERGIDLYTAELGRRTFEQIRRNDLRALATLLGWFRTGSRVTHNRAAWYGTGTVLAQYPSGTVYVEWSDGSRFHADCSLLTRV